MKVKELKDLLSRHTRQDDEDVQIYLALPSVGGRATSVVKNAAFGFDWDTGLILHATERLVPKTDKQDIWEQANDLMMYLATRPMKRESYEKRTAKAILLRNGYTQEQLDKYQKFFHRET